ncbi:hypothetical protein BpHYR1_002351 [Brachionus plicatilis]|uniref:Uncharacterized protein n=1 Tax=Brachionus plicatilis TaxID=10195 RepID=A0A3M7PJN1_BRAPC|nr:hypothetical protein BpHYR1_002351 [Brachionus plicatilis]
MTFLERSLLFYWIDWLICNYNTFLKYDWTKNIRNFIFIELLNLNDLRIRMPEKRLLNFLVQFEESKTKIIKSFSDILKKYFTIFSY